MLYRTAKFKFTEYNYSLGPTTKINSHLYISSYTVCLCLLYVACLCLYLITNISHVCMHCTVIGIMGKEARQRVGNVSKGAKKRHLDSASSAPPPKRWKAQDRESHFATIPTIAAFCWYWWRQDKSSPSRARKRKTPERYRSSIAKGDFPGETSVYLVYAGICCRVNREIQVSYCHMR